MRSTPLREQRRHDRAAPSLEEIKLLHSSQTEVLDYGSQALRGDSSKLSKLKSSCSVVASLASIYLPLYRAELFFLGGGGGGNLLLG